MVEQGSQYAMTQKQRAYNICIFPLMPLVLYVCSLNKYKILYLANICFLNSTGRVPVLHAGSSGFESLRKHHKYIINHVYNCKVMQHGTVRQVVSQKDTSRRLLSVCSDTYREEVKLKTEAVCKNYRLIRHQSCRSHNRRYSVQ